MNSKIIAVFLIACFAQGMVNGSLRKKRQNPDNEIRIKMDSLVKSVRKDVLEKFLENPEELKTAVKYCDSSKDLCGKLEAQSIISGGLFETLKTDGQCDEKYHYLGKKISTIGKICDSYVKATRSSDVIDDWFLKAEIAELELKLISGIYDLDKCEDKHPTQTPEGHIEGANDLQKVVEEFITEVVDSCNGAIVPFSTNNLIKVGDNQEPRYEIYHFVSVLSKWLKDLTTVVRKCSPAQFDILALSSQWKTCQQNFIELANTQGNDYKCQKSLFNLSEYSARAGQLLGEYVIYLHSPANTNLDSWQGKNLELAQSIMETLEKINAATSCPEAIEIINNCRSNIAEGVESIEKDVNECKSSATPPRYESAIGKLFLKRF